MDSKVVDNLNACITLNDRVEEVKVSVSTGNLKEAFTKFRSEINASLTLAMENEEEERKRVKVAEEEVSSEDEDVSSS